MSKGFGHISRPHLHKEHQNRDTHTQTWDYQIPINSTLADVSLEKGDLLPEDSAFQIIEASKKTTVNKDTSWASWARVTAVKFFGF